MTREKNKSFDEAEIRNEIDAILKGVRVRDVDTFLPPGSSAIELEPDGGNGLIHWLCNTLGFRKADPEWKAEPQRVAVPFDMESGKVLLDLKR